MFTKSKLSPTQSVKPNPSVIYRRLGDELVLFHLETDRFYELNDTAARFWELLSESDENIYDKMSTEFAVDSGDLVHEAEALVAMLRKEDLISVAE